jgi:hypothetical protein
VVRWPSEISQQGTPFGAITLFVHSFDASHGRFTDRAKLMATLK